MGCHDLCHGRICDCSSGSFLDTEVQNIKSKDDKEERESNVIGHDRFYQERSRSSVRLKKRVTRRSNSSAEFTNATLDAAKKRAKFKLRSHSSSSDQKSGDEVGSSDSFTKLFTKRASSVPRHEYSALKADGGCERYRLEKEVRDGAFSACRQYLADNERYELKTQLGDIGSRADKHWFIVQDTSLGAERLLSLVPIPVTCPISPSPATRETLLALFRGLQHPYIHPILDVEFWEAGAALISPLNPAGSLRDIIYGSAWHDNWDRKYAGRRGEGLPLREVQCLGRQILEALLFLRNKNFPPFYHLHSGNVIIQNGVARVAGFENPLLGLLPRPSSSPETLAFGYLLYEMAAGYELPSPPSPAHLELELERTPKIAEVLSLIFQPARLPLLEELLCCDLFRGVELRELRGASGVHTRSASNVLELLDLVRCPVVPSPIRRKDVVLVVESRQLEDIIEEDLDNEEVEDTNVVSSERAQISPPQASIYKGKDESKCVFIKAFRDKAYVKMLYDNHSTESNN